MQDFKVSTEYYGDKVVFDIRPFKTFFSIELEHQLISILGHRENWIQLIGDLPDIAVDELIAAIESNVV